MDGLPKAKRAPGDEASLQAWKDMRMEIVHEVQDGAVVSDESMEALANLEVVLESWPPAQLVPAQPVRR